MLQLKRQEGLDLVVIDPLSVFCPDRTRIHAPMPAAGAGPDRLRAGRASVAPAAQGTALGETVAIKLKGRQTGCRGLRL
jgi:hypothetical protein